MENAHQRMGRLTFVRQSRDSVTDVSVYLEKLVAEAQDDRSATFHLVSVFGGDQEIGAVIAAAQEGLRFQTECGERRLLGTVGEKPVVYRASLQIPGRKRPVRHAILLSRTFYETTLGANSGARRTVLFDSTPEFVLHRLSARFGLPVLPRWPEWFHHELLRRRDVEPLAGWNCTPIAVKGTKLRMLRLLALGLRRGSIRLSDDCAKILTPDSDDDAPLGLSSRRGQ